MNISINLFTKICNGECGYTFPSSQTTQYINLVGNTSSISQTINFPRCGTYTLSLSYAFSSTYSPNKLSISLNGNNISFINTSTNTASWLSYSVNIVIPQIGNNTLLLAGVLSATLSTTCIALTNIQLAYYSEGFGTGITPPEPDNTYNLLNRSSVYGSFIVKPRFTNYIQYGNV